MPEGYSSSLTYIREMHRDSANSGRGRLRVGGIPRDYASYYSDAGQEPNGQPKDLAILLADRFSQFSPLPGWHENYSATTPLTSIMI
jgi:hypothetical protein